ncbi:MAG: polysaccharide biosynthesis C-terminal domain-containing protein [Bacteroidales bacterium]|nr:polysaccharide biosynthesis C-terminal domain-containing protein [Bacteroidales bacterium]
MNNIKKLAGQTVVYGLGTIIPRVLNYLILTPFYTRIFLKGEYGVITELYAYVAFLMVLLTYGMETGFFRFSEQEKNPDKVYSTSLISLFITSLLFIILIINFAQPIADLIQYSSNKEYIIWFGIIISCDAFSTIPFARLRQQNKALKFSLIKIFNVSVNIGFNVFFFIICPYLEKHYSFSFIDRIYSKEIGVGYAFISNLIASILTLFLLFKDVIKVKLYFDFSLLKNILKYSYPLLIVGLAGMINEVADKVFLKYLLPENINAMEQVGIYGANYKLAILMTIFIQMFRFAAEPFFFKQVKEKNPKETYADVMKYFIIFGLFIFLGVMLYMDIVKYFIDDKFHEGLKIVPIVLIANLFLGIFYNLSVWYKINNLTHFGAMIAIFGAIVTIILNIILIPKIGYLGSAYATFVCYLTMMFFSYFLGQHFYKIKYDIKTIVIYFIVALGLYFISVKFEQENEVIKLSINTLLIIVFIITVMFLEKISIRTIRANK